MIYLLHYDRPQHHAQHYLGFTDDLDARTVRHLNGFRGRLPAVFSELGISFTIARNWEGDRKLERKLKKRKNGRKLCPICLKEKHGGVRRQSPKTVRLPSFAAIHHNSHDTGMTPGMLAASN